jgi:hypothetical protein
MFELSSLQELWGLMLVACEKSLQKLEKVLVPGTHHRRFSGVGQCLFVRLF